MEYYCELFYNFKFPQGGPHQPFEFNRVKQQVHVYPSLVSQTYMQQPIDLTTTTTTKSTAESAIDLTLDSSSSSTSSSSSPMSTAKEQYAARDIVDVKRRMGPGQNKPGGIARIKKVHALPDGSNTYDVQYITRRGIEKQLPPTLLSPYVILDESPAKRKRTETAQNPNPKVNSKENVIKFNL